MDIKKLMNGLGGKKEEPEAEKRNYFNLNQEDFGLDEDTPKEDKKEKKAAKPSSAEGAPAGRRSQRKKMSKKEKKMRIALNWTVFAVAVILVVFIIIKLITGAIHLATGSSNKEAEKDVAVAEATTQAQVEETKPAEPVEITISAIGDCVLGTDETFGYEGGFTEKYDEVNNPAYFFENVKPVLEQDDLTIANLEVALTKSLNMSDNEYNFKGEPEYAKILSEGSVEAANLANSHTHDYGEDGYEDTIEYVEQVGVKTFGDDRTAIVGVKGVKVGLIGINVDDDDVETYTQQVQTDISNLRLEGAQLVIVSFHWGIEQETSTTQTQRALGHAAIDAGADLVLGHHPHVLQGIEEYNGKNIVYSLANFVYGANSSPDDYATMIYQQTFTVTGDQVSNDLRVNVIPCRVSSSEEFNNFQPMIAEGEKEEIILGRIQEYTQEVMALASETTSTEEGEETEAAEDADDAYYDESGNAVEEESGDNESEEGSGESNEESYEESESGEEY